MIILFTILVSKYEAFIEDANVFDEIAKMMQSIPRILKLMLECQNLIVLILLAI